MRNRKFMIGASALLLSLPATADTAADKAAVNEAFSGYQVAMKNGDTEDATKQSPGPRRVRSNRKFSLRATL